MYVCEGEATRLNVGVIEKREKIETDPWDEGNEQQREILLLSIINYQQLQNKVTPYTSVLCTSSLVSFTRHTSTNLKTLQIVDFNHI